MNLVIGITGASGSCYARRLIEVLAAAGHTCRIVVSRAGKAVIAHEIKEAPKDWPAALTGGEHISLWEDDDLFAPFCSGSNPPDAMVVVPCSMGTLGRIASGISENLLTRAADVCLKERRPLILAVRETPLNLIHIENMDRVTRAGAIVMPASPGFYHRPTDLADIVDHFVGKLLDTLGITHSLFSKWGSDT
jgi:4-hydroxy-3-polyprenylbenzoate decarboxylase